MKVILGKYRAPVMCRLFTDYMNRTHILGWPDEYSRYERFLEILEDSVQWVLDHTVNPFRRKEGYEYIRIDYWDTWSMDHTLAPIILPMLRQLVDTKHGAPNVDPQDVPDELKPTAVELLKYQKDGETDEKFFARWDYVMDEMIYAFDCKANRTMCSCDLKTQKKRRLSRSGYQTVSVCLANIMKHCGTSLVYTNGAKTQHFC